MRTAAGLLAVALPFAYPAAGDAGTSGGRGSAAAARED